MVLVSTKCDLNHPPLSEEAQDFINARDYAHIETSVKLHKNIEFLKAMITKEPEFDESDLDLEEMIKSLQVQYQQSGPSTKESINIHEIRRRLFQSRELDESGFGELSPNHPKFKVYTQPADIRQEAKKVIPVKQVFLTSSRNTTRSAKKLSEPKSVSPVSSRPRLSDLTPQAKSNAYNTLNSSEKSLTGKSAQKSPSPINRGRQKLNQTSSSVPKKPPIMHIEITLGSTTVKEEVFASDRAYDVAVRVLKPHNSAPKIIQLLSDTIEQTINDYTAGIAKELAAYQRKAGLMDWEYRKKLLNRFKPPQLATMKRAEKKKQPIGDVNIEIENRSLTLSVREGDDPETLARIFCKKHSLPEESIQELKVSIRDLILSHQTLLFSLNFELGDETFSVDIHEKDDLFMVAQKFVAEHSLDPSSVSKIHKILIENMEAYKSRSFMSK